jgi:hypothetical protein
MTIGEASQRPARDVAHALGLHRQGAGEDLLAQPERQLDGVVLDRRHHLGAQLIYRLDRSCRGFKRQRRLRARGGQAGRAALGLAREPSLSADLLGLRPRRREDVGHATGGGAIGRSRKLLERERGDPRGPGRRGPGIRRRHRTRHA